MKPIRIAQLLCIHIFLLTLFFGHEVFAAAPNCPEGRLCNPLKADNLNQVWATLLKYIIKIGTIIVVIYVIWAGFLFVKAGGSSTKIEEAKKALFSSLIGGLILLGAQAISMVIQNTVNQINK
jgi:hypothetical protein